VLEASRGFHLPHASMPGKSRIPYPMRLRQILLNLLSNACKFPKEGEVKLKARRVTEGIELAVADTGASG
jgi:signal transduction histidine kinase